MNISILESRDIKNQGIKKELKRIVDSGNQRKLSFALAKKQRDEVRGHVCTEAVVQFFNSFC